MINLNQGGIKMKTNKILIGLIALIILSSAVLAKPTSKYDFSQLGSSAYFDQLTTSCHKNSDCSIASSSPCGCYNGGNQIAVNKLGLIYWNWKNTQYDLSQIVCMGVYNCAYTQSLCINKVCTLNKFTGNIILS
jgi:hypothetical protein